jgi:2-polyprenyl-3-methyl-5-hydroxy-6-metoxy-1,4-benzoquinol methylase
MEVVHARDAALGKVAAIGNVNPRPPGLVNSLVQCAKRLVARALDWHVRDQVEFNRGVMACVEALLAALDENNRTLSALAAECARRIDSGRAATTAELAESRKAVNDLAGQASALHEEARELKDIRKHWAEWRVEWERKLSINEVQFLRSAADLQTGFQHRVTMMENNLRELAKTQHAYFESALNRSADEIQKKLWADLEKVRREYENIIHNELRIVRQRAAVPAAAPMPAPAAPPPALDWLQFADKFARPEQSIRERQRYYVSDFKDCREVLDIGCGRGEFLEVMKEAGIAARGIDLCEEAVALCRAKSLDAEVADLFCLSRRPSRRVPRRHLLGAGDRTPSAGASTRVHSPGCGQAAPRRRAGHRDAQSGVPGHFRHALSSGSDAHAAHSARAAQLLHDRGRLRPPGGPQARARGRIVRGLEGTAGRVPRHLLRRNGLRSFGAQDIVKSLAARWQLRMA